jgi:Ca2+/Na+ antiporter
MNHPPSPNLTPNPTGWGAGQPGFPCSYCVYSSYIFLGNCFLAYYFEDYIYSLLFLCLSITSIIHLSSYNIYTSIIDKISVYCVIFYGGYVFYKKYKKNIEKNNDNDNDNDENKDNKKNIPIFEYIKYFVVIITFLLVIFLYYYGYITNNYTFHPDEITAQIYHCIMHFIASFGHAVIITL